MSKETKDLKVVEVEVLTSKKGNKYLKGHFAPLEKGFVINLVSKETNKRIPLDDLSGKMKVSYSGYVLNETQEFLTLFKVNILKEADEVEDLYEISEMIVSTDDLPF